MSPSTGNSSKIRRIVRIRQMLFRWRNKARVTAARAPPDVPAGHVAVCVGPRSMRFIVRATYLNHPIFKKLLVEAEEEYGFCNHGPLAIPCDEELFKELLQLMGRPEYFPLSSVEDLQKSCDVNVRSSRCFDCAGESWPLLRDEPIY